MTCGRQGGARPRSFFRNQIFRMARRNSSLVSFSRSLPIRAKLARRIKGARNNKFRTIFGFNHIASPFYLEFSIWAVTCFSAGNPRAGRHPARVPHHAPGRHPRGPATPPCQGRHRRVRARENPRTHVQGQEGKSSSGPHSCWPRVLRIPGRPAAAWQARRPRGGGARRSDGLPMARRGAPSLLAEKIESRQIRLGIRTIEVRPEAEYLTGQIAEADHQEGKLLDLYLDGGLDSPVLRARTQEVRERRRSLEERAGRGATPDFKPGGRGRPPRDDSAPLPAGAGGTFKAHSGRSPTTPPPASQRDRPPGAGRRDPWGPAGQPTRPRPKQLSSPGLLRRCGS